MKASEVGKEVKAKCAGWGHTVSESEVTCFKEQLTVSVTLREIVADGSIEERWFASANGREGFLFEDWVSLVQYGESQRRHIDAQRAFELERLVRKHPHRVEAMTGIDVYEWVYQIGFAEGKDAPPDGVRHPGHPGNPEAVEKALKETREHMKRQKESDKWPRKDLPPHGTNQRPRLG